METIIVLLFTCYEMIIIVRVICSWIRVDPRNPAVMLIENMTEPVLAPVRRLLPTDRMGFDISPLIVIFALGLLERLILQVLS